MYFQHLPFAWVCFFFNGPYALIISCLFWQSKTLLGWGDDPTSVNILFQFQYITKANQIKKFIISKYMKLSCCQQKESNLIHLNAHFHLFNTRLSWIWKDYIKQAIAVVQIISHQFNLRNTKHTTRVIIWTQLLTGVSMWICVPFMP